MKNAERLLERRSEPTMLCKAEPVKNLSGQGICELECTERPVANEWRRNQKKGFNTQCKNNDYKRSRCGISTNSHGRKHTQQASRSYCREWLRVYDSLQSGSQADSNASSSEDPWNKSCSGQRIGHLKKASSMWWNSGKHSKSDLIRQAMKEGKRAHFANAHGCRFIWKMKWNNTFQKSTNVILYSEATLFVTILATTQHSQSELLQLRVWRQQVSWIRFRDWPDEKDKRATL